MNKEVILIGGFHEIIELCEDSDINILGIIDNKLVNEYMGYPIIGADKDAPELYTKFKRYPLILAPDQPLLREKLFNYYSDLGYTFTSLICKTAKISRSALIGNGTIIQNGVNISSSSNIGNFVKLNTNANIMHDSSIADFSTVAPDAVILGRVIVQNSCYIGSNSTILPGILIRKLTTVGAGAVVTKDTEESDIVVGIPAKKTIK
jgi:sugar O-acyltransferase (sialic acid O-acetyltransferase NeuD family)